MADLERDAAAVEIHKIVERITGMRLKTVHVAYIPEDSIDLHALQSIREGDREPEGYRDSDHLPWRKPEPGSSQ